MAAKRKRTSLPRVTVLAFNRRDLAAFAQAVEKLGLLVEDLRLMLERKKVSVKPKPTAPGPAPLGKLVDDVLAKMTS